MTGAATVDEFLGRLLLPSGDSAKSADGIQQPGMNRDQLRSGTLAAAQASRNIVDRQIREFILDTGASIHIGQYDKLTDPEARFIDLDEPLTLDSANGEVRVTQYVDSYCPTLGCTIPSA